MPRPTGQKRDAHARIYGKWRTLPAWTALTPLEIAILVEAIRDCGLYQEDMAQKNIVRITSARLRKRWSCSHKTASNALLRLQETGWLERIGLAPGPTGQAGGVYEVMTLDASLQPRNGPFKHWRPNG